MNIFSNKCIGFDLRIKEQYLSKQILSADPGVLRRTTEIQDLLDSNMWTVSNPLNLFLDQELMEQFYHENKVNHSLLKLCLTTSVINIHTFESIYGEGWLENLPDEKELISNDWELCGFDIVDYQGLISGISGCGEVNDRQSISSLLNHYQLFRDQEKARCYAETRGIQIRSHAPFITVGVFIKE